jgi:hypothetical protein
VNHPATLTRLTPRTWQGALHGYIVQVFAVGTPASWHAAILRDGYTCVVLPAESLADGGRRAREWIERHQPTQKTQPPQ